MKSTAENKPSANRLSVTGALAAQTCPLLPILACALALGSGVARASVAYGSINNFDTVNDTGVPCHGFEIELDDIHSADITYTFDWNHYGVPSIIEDNSDPMHPKVFVRYASAKTNGVWEAYTAVPSGPIAPTQGHQFTDPSVNFGGEHFGVGYRTAPAAIKYNWLIDDGNGVLIHGGAVNVATPTFTYFPPAAGMPAQVQALIVPPPPPEQHVLEFGPPSWVKEIRTTTHNNNEMKLRDLVSDDPGDPDDKNWRNGEPDEVEVEWQLLQTEFKKADGGRNGKLEGAPEDLDNGDEIITRRYEFYKYVGPIDPETGEAMTDNVGPDGIHGIGDYANTIVVGEFFGAQMSAFDIDAPIGLIDHLPDGEIDVPYDTRTVVIASTPSFVATTSGSLPYGMTFDLVKGELSGTPTASGVFVFNVQVTSSNSPAVTKAYAFTIADAGVILPPHSSVDTSASPVDGGTTTGTGVYTNGSSVTVVARPNSAFDFVNWTDNGTIVSTNASYQFTIEVNRPLVANFGASVIPRLEIQSATNAIVISWATNFAGFKLERNATLGGTNWTAVTNEVAVVGATRRLIASPTETESFFRLISP